MLKPFHLHSKLFRGYLRTIIGVIVITLSIMGIVTTRRIAKNMKEEGIRITENRLLTIAEDLENQLETIREMVVEVSSHQEFRLDFIQKNKYYELEALKKLKNYSQVSGIDDFFFIKYKEKENIYTSVGTTMPLRVCLKDKLGLQTSDEIIEEIESLYGNTDIDVVVWRDGDLIMLLYPMKRYSTGWNKTEGVICVKSSVKELKDRMEKIAGEINGSITVTFQDTCLLSEENETNQEDTITMTSRTERMKVNLCVDTDLFFNWKNVFANDDMVTFAIITIILLMLAYVVSRYFFYPIQTITEKYNSVANDSLVPSWDSINDLIDALISGNEKDKIMLQEQYRMLREQTIQLVVLGGSLDKLQKYLTLLNIQLDASFFGVIACVFPEEQSEEDTKSICRNIEELSEKEVSLYPYCKSRSVINILTSVEEEYQFGEVIELLLALFESMELEARIKLTAKSNRLEDLQNSDKKDIKTKIDSPVNTEESIKIGKKNNTAVQIIEYMKANCTDYSLSLDMVAQAYGITPSYICRIIKQEVGMSYKEYLTGLRIAQAKAILADEGIGIKEVCERVGYTNVSHFIKVFTNHTGVTPAKYRDMNQN